MSRERCLSLDHCIVISGSLEERADRGGRQRKKESGEISALCALQWMILEKNQSVSCNPTIIFVCELYILPPNNQLLRAALIASITFCSITGFTGTKGVFSKKASIWSWTRLSGQGALVFLKE